MDNFELRVPVFSFSERYLTLKKTPKQEHAPQLLVFNF